MRNAALFLLVPTMLALLHCGGGNDTTPDDEAAPVTAGHINGGETGAMVRETTPPGYVRIEGTWTVPDYDPSQQGEPWIYYGFGDEGTIDMEIGLAFQKGDGSAEKPHRYLPYMRKGKNFSFGDETTRALPGDTFTFAAWLDRAGVHAAKDGATLTFNGPTGAIDTMPMPGLSSSHTHIRRVVGQALATTYRGEPLGTLGPVTFEGTTITSATGTAAPFHGIATWKQLRNGTLYGSVKFPSAGIRHTYDTTSGTDVITLFP